MTKLRRQLQRELALRGRSPRTQESYERAVSGLATYYDRSPDRIKDDEIKDYLLYLIQERDLSAGSMNVYVSGLRFFYQKVLNRSIAEVEASLPRPRRPVRRPRVFSEEEIARLLQHGCTTLKQHAFLATVYAAGLRVSEACNLKVTDIDSARMQIRVEQGKGSKDRYTLLSPTLLELLRTYWRAYRPKYWLFQSSRIPEKPLDPGTGQYYYYAALKKAGLPRKGGIHSLRHSFATHLLERGADLAVLQRLLGHRRLSSSAVYLHVQDERLARLRNPLDLLDVGAALQLAQQS